ncbi:MAG: 50S ribosomal protein L24 [Candidatus Obscuribacterales bacterium]|nr:50S ribosomal protein L24 [Candidatus Obscuribacterales bacterium]
MEGKKHREIRYTKAPAKAKVKEGGNVVVSEALHKKGSSNLQPKTHLKRGDTVMLMVGPKKEDKKRSKEDTNRLAERNAFKGTIGKVLAVYPKEGKVLVEGVNLMTHFIKARAGMGGEAGIVRKEAPLFASKVMLYDPEKKRPVRGDKRKELSL